MTTNAPSCSTHHLPEAGRSLLAVAGIGLAVVLSLTACQPDLPSSSSPISTAELDSSPAPFPEISQELETGPPTTTGATPVTLLTNPPTTPTTPHPTTASSNPSLPSEGQSVPGSVLDYGPPAGASLTVVGVRYDDVLNFRMEPDPTSMVMLTVAPLQVGAPIVALGQAWIAPSGIWWKVRVSGQDLWASQAYLAGVGHGDDFFFEVSQDLGLLRFVTITDAAIAAAGTRSSNTPQSRVVVSVGPIHIDGTHGTVTVDVLDLGDDSVKGERLWIDVDFILDDSGQMVESVVLVDVYIQPLCGRGSNGEGLCL